MSDKFIEVGNIAPTKSEVVVTKVVSEVVATGKLSEVVTDNKKVLEESSDEDILESSLEKGIIVKSGTKYSVSGSDEKLTKSAILAYIAENKESITEALTIQLINLNQLIDVLWEEKVITQDEESKEYLFDSTSLGKDWENIPEDLYNNHDLLVDLLLSIDQPTIEETRVVESTLLEDPIVQTTEVSSEDTIEADPIDTNDLDNLPEESKNSSALFCVKNIGPRAIILQQGADKFSLPIGSTLPLQSIPVWVRKHYEYHGAIKSKHLIMGSLKDLITKN